MVVICGAENEDMYVAAHTKSFLIAAYWVPLKEKVIQYGVPAPTPRKMRAILDIMRNQTSWYYSCSFNDPVPTKIVSLCLANTYESFRVSQVEIKMAKAFEAILKYGANNPVMRQALLCHLMAGEDIQLTTNYLFWSWHFKIKGFVLIKRWVLKTDQIATLSGQLFTTL